MPAFEALPGMPYWQDLITTDPQQAAYFYSKVLGWEVSQDAYRVARKDGLPVAGVVRAEQGVPAWVVYFSRMGRRRCGAWRSSAARWSVARTWRSGA